MLAVWPQGGRSQAGAPAAPEARPYMVISMINIIIVTIIIIIMFSSSSSSSSISIIIAW